MGIECRTFLPKLSEFLTTKRDLSKSIVRSWVRTKISSAFIRMMLCLQGEHLMKSSTMALNGIDVQEDLTKNQREH